MAVCAYSVCIAVVDGEERVVGARQVRRQPGCGCVAGGACGGPPRRDVIGICGTGEIGLMAGVAVGRRTRENVVDMARGAGDGNVRPGQREGRVVVIECRSGP